MDRLRRSLLTEPSHGGPEPAGALAQETEVDHTRQTEWTKEIEDLVESWIDEETDFYKYTGLQVANPHQKPTDTWTTLNVERIPIEKRPRGLKLETAMRRADGKAVYFIVQPGNSYHDQILTILMANLPDETEVPDDEPWIVRLKPTQVKPRKPSSGKRSAQQVYRRIIDEQKARLQQINREIRAFMTSIETGMDEERVLYEIERAEDPTEHGDYDPDLAEKSREFAGKMIEIFEQAKEWGAEIKSFDLNIIPGTRQKRRDRKD